MNFSERSIKSWIRASLSFFGKLVALLLAAGIPFRWFLIELAEHGWK